MEVESTKGGVISYALLVLSVCRAYFRFPDGGIFGLNGFFALSPTCTGSVGSAFWSGCSQPFSGLLLPFGLLYLPSTPGDSLMGKAGNIP